MKKFSMVGKLMEIETFPGKESAQARLVLGFLGDTERIHLDPNRVNEMRQFINKDVVVDGTIEHQLRVFGKNVDERYSFHAETVKKSSDK